MRVQIRFLLIVKDCLKTKISAKLSVDQMKVGRIPVMDIVDHYEEEVEGRIEILLEDALR